MPFKIKQMWAYLAVDAAGDEGICEFRSTRSSLMMIFPDQKTADQFRDAAQSIATKLGKKMTLVRFDTRTDVEEIVPK